MSGRTLIKEGWTISLIAEEEMKTLKEEFVMVLTYRVTSPSQYPSYLYCYQWPDDLKIDSSQCQKLPDEVRKVFYRFIGDTEEEEVKTSVPNFTPTSPNQSEEGCISPLIDSMLGENGYI